MDLGAYANINSIEQIAKQNNINVPRCRGYRLMENEKPLSKDEIQEIENSMISYIYEWACRSVPKFYPESDLHEYSLRTDFILKKYFNNKEFKWQLVHGKARKRIKFAIKKIKKAVNKQYEIFNKYAGREDVLYIHARIGGNNWNYFEGYLLEKEPWFLEKVDDCFDNTYCDIYAKINNIN